MNPNEMTADEMPFISQLRSQIESILLVIDSPATSASIARAVEATVEEVEAVLEEIRTELDMRGSGIELRTSEEGWRYFTRRDNADAVEQFMLDGTQTRLSRAALETLAVVAYRQPCTRAQVAAVRGVNVDGVMRTLTLRGLVREIEDGEFEGPGIRYETTALFPELLGIDSLERLPDLAPLLPDVDMIDEEY